MIMDYKVFYITRWFKDVRFCGGFNTLYQSVSYVDYLQNKLPNGNKITFKIEKNQEHQRAA